MTGGVPIPACLVDKTTRDRFEFQFNPNEITDKLVGGWVDTKIPGSTHPRLQYGGGGGRSWTFKLQLYRDSSDDAEVMKKAAWLQARMVPEYDSQQNLKAPPHVCMFVWGSLYSVQVVIREATVKFSKLFTPDELLPIFADIDIRLDEFSDGSIGFDDLNPGSL